MCKVNPPNFMPPDYDSFRADTAVRPCKVWHVIPSQPFIGWIFVCRIWDIDRLLAAHRKIPGG